VNFFSAQPNGPAPREHCNCVTAVLLAVAAVAAAALQASDGQHQHQTTRTSSGFGSNLQSCSTLTAGCVLWQALLSAHSASVSWKQAYLLLPQGYDTTGLPSYHIVACSNSTGAAAAAVSGHVGLLVVDFDDTITEKDTIGALMTAAVEANVKVWILDSWKTLSAWSA
jgi:hypothetical protein